MADILITGALDFIPDSTVRALSEESRVVLAGKSVSKESRGRRISSYLAEPADEQFRQLLDVYAFKAVCFVSGFTDGGAGRYGEVQQLEQLMAHCRQAEVKKLIVISTVESLNFEFENLDNNVGRKEHQSGRAFLAGQLEDLCRFYAKEAGMKIITLHLPYLADPDYNKNNFLSNIFRKLYNSEKLEFPSGRNDRIDFISARDLARLLRSIIDEKEDISRSFFVCSGYVDTWGGAFLARLKNCASSAPDPQFTDESSRVAWRDYPDDLRRVYGFIPMDHVLEDLEEYYDGFVQKIVNKHDTLWDKCRAFLRNQKGSFKYIEMIIVFFLVEFLNLQMSVSIYFKFVDIRLLFIVMIAIIYGMRMGLYAAGLECIALVWQYRIMGMDWTLLFYNIENWIPFAAYMTVGSVVGYIKNKNTDELRFMKDEHRLLYDKYLFLNNAYRGALENKKEYKTQIIGFKDSFGKIFDAVQRLDSVVPQKIYFEGLKVMEDILANRSIAIYSLDGWQKYGRLAICSSRMTTTLAKSFSMEEHLRLCETVKAGNVWKNTELLPNEPMYADGVIQDGRLALLIVIYHADMEQYSIRYMNIFHILCGLVQSAFLRARDYEQWLESQIYYPGTHVMYPERFLEIVKAQEDMKRSGVADYMLVRMVEKDKNKVGGRASTIIRNTDLIGADRDGNLYLLLPQAGTDTFHVVGERLEKQNLQYEIVKEVG